MLNVNLMYRAYVEDNGSICFIVTNFCHALFQAGMPYTWIYLYNTIHITCNCFSL